MKARGTRGSGDRESRRQLALRPLWGANEWRVRHRRVTGRGTAHLELGVAVHTHHVEVCDPHAHPDATVRHGEGGEGGLNSPSRRRIHLRGDGSVGKPEKRRRLVKKDNGKM